MWAKVKNGGSFLNTLGVEIPEASSFICESIEDIKNLPLDTTNAAIGSTCAVVPTGEVYMRCPSGWIKYKGVAIVN